MLVPEISKLHKMKYYIMAIYVALAIAGDLSSVDNIEIEKGKPLSIFCDLNGTAGEGLRVEWIKDGEENSTLNTGDTYTIFDNNTLLINNAEPGDAGNYKCRTISLSPYSIKFLVYYFYLDEMSPETIVPEFSNVTLTCLVDGKPSPSVQWFKNQQKLNDSDDRYLYDANKFRIQKAVISMENVTKADEGTFECKIHGDMNTWTTSTVLKITDNVDPDADGGLEILHIVLIVIGSVVALFLYVRFVYLVVQIYD